MFDKLRDYCRWNMSDQVQEYLSQNFGLLVTEEDGVCIRLAISNNSPEILETLLHYFVKSLPQNKQSSEHAAAMQVMVDIFDEYIDLEDLSPEIIKVIYHFLPIIIEKALLEAVESGNTTIVKELYPYFPESTKDILKAAIKEDKFEIIDTLVSMAINPKDAAKILCNAADISSDYSNAENTIKLYESSIELLPKYFIAHLHYANYLQKQYCDDTNFDSSIAEVAKTHYEYVISALPKYTCAYKKLGMLYQICSEHDSDNANELANKAFDAYAKAIEYKTEKLQYNSVYLAIEQLIEKFGFFDAKIVIQDTKLKEILSTASSSSDSRDSSILSIETLPMIYEDTEYEECFMDDDLEAQTSSEEDSIIREEDGSELGFYKGNYLEQTNLLGEDGL